MSEASQQESKKSTKKVALVVAGVIVSLVVLAFVAPAMYSLGHNTENPILKCKRPENARSAFCQSLKNRPDESWDSIRANGGRPNPVFRLTKPNSSKDKQGGLGAGVD